MFFEPRTVSEKLKWIDWQHPQLSGREQCRLLGLNRSNLYYEPIPETQENLQIMRMIDQEYMQHPCKRQRQMVRFLDRQGVHVNRKRVQRLMKNMGLEGLAPKPRTTIPSKGNRAYQEPVQLPYAATRQNAQYHHGDFPPRKRPLLVFHSLFCHPRLLTSWTTGSKVPSSW